MAETTWTSLFFWVPLTLILMVLCKAALDVVLRRRDLLAGRKVSDQDFHDDHSKAA